MAQGAWTDSRQSSELTRAKIWLLIHASIINPGTYSKVKLYLGRGSSKEYSEAFACPTPFFDER